MAMVVLTATVLWVCVSLPMISAQATPVTTTPEVCVNNRVTINSMVNDLFLAGNPSGDDFYQVFTTEGWPQGPTGGLNTLVVSLGNYTDPQVTPIVSEITFTVSGAVGSSLTIIVENTNGSHLVEESRAVTSDPMDFQGLYHTKFAIIWIETVGSISNMVLEVCYKPSVPSVDRTLPELELLELEVFLDGDIEETTHDFFDRVVINCEALKCRMGSGGGKECVNLRGTGYRTYWTKNDGGGDQHIRSQPHGMYGNLTETYNMDVKLKFGYTTLEIWPRYDDAENRNGTYTCWAISNNEGMHSAQKSLSLTFRPNPLAPNGELLHP